MLGLLVLLGSLPVDPGLPTLDRWWDEKVEVSLARVPEHRAHWGRMLASVQPEARPGMAYLLVNLPFGDLQTLAPEKLHENVTLAYKARAEVAWGPSLPEPVFLDAVLPHASVTEKREPMRGELHERYMPLVKPCRRPGEAALLLNKSLFKDFGVSYNTRRVRPDQSARESIAQGMATCTGLSIMLVEACRAVGIPARLAGIHSWPGRGGNHTWVEVWDDGWHFVGAAEPDEKGLDHAWFAGEAARAIRGSSHNAIFAVTYRQTVDHFPLAWAPDARINAEDVSDRYKQTPASARSGPGIEQRERMISLLSDRFGSNPSKASDAKKQLAAVRFVDPHRELAWNAYRQSPVHDKLRKEFETKTVSARNRVSPYLWRHVGTKPKAGWPLVIAMHGGGGTTKEINDAQWKRMFEQHYHDHPDAGGYVYLALRAPNDTWNGFYDDAIAPLVARLILQFVLFAEVDSDRVYLLGASHGGYGAFVIGPKIPDRFAAIHASAAAPTDGETMGENLRNTIFTFMVGSNDTAYGRDWRCQKFAEELESWRRERGGYPGAFEWKPGVGHSVPDREKVGEMLCSAPRNPWPKQVVWVQSDDILRHFYWLESPRPADQARIEAVVTGNTVTIKTHGQRKLVLWLDAMLVDLTQPVTVDIGDGKPRSIVPSPDLQTYCDSLEDRGDPRLAAPVRIAVEMD
jgi:transglutaminase-like putative cysteine protease